MNQCALRAQHFTPRIQIHDCDYPAYEKSPGLRVGARGLKLRAYVLRLTEWSEEPVNHLPEQFFRLLLLNEVQRERHIARLVERRLTIGSDATQPDGFTVRE